MITKSHIPTPDTWHMHEELLRKGHASQEFDVWNYAKGYTDLFDKLVSAVAKEAARRTWGEPKLSDVAIFLFGSPARYELLGESDADILILRKKDTSEVKQFQNTFSRLLGVYGFVKIDIPEWGTIDDCKSYVTNAVTEGNQVLEARFLLGDQKIRKAIESLVKKYANQDKFRRVLCFQYHYFNQYYAQRGRKGVLNLKYGHGGTRDLLFLVWLSNFRDGIGYVKGKNCPAALSGLNSLLDHNDITPEEFDKYKKSIGYVLALRNEMLRINRGTRQEGLTFFDAQTRRRLLKDRTILSTFGFENPDEFLQHTYRCLMQVLELKKKIWSIFNRASDEKNNKSEDVVQILTNIWTAPHNNRITTSMLRANAKSDNWEILTSIACRKDCPSDVLDLLAKKGQKKGFEYLLKIIGRNRRTPKSTLQYIAGNTKIELRFRLPAITNLKIGVKRANELM